MFVCLVLIEGVLGGFGFFDFEDEGWWVVVSNDGDN